MLTIEQIYFCAAQCKLQQSGEESVGDMCAALQYADEMSLRVITPAVIKRMGQLVEPEQNKHGFRDHAVYFKDPTIQAIPANQIERALTSLCTNGADLTAMAWYFEFEQIHPFIDGNGRVGAILFNMRNRDLLSPIQPPRIDFQVAV